MYFACPRCDWRPTLSAQWMCTCGHKWNVFETRGVCPECGKAWPLTQCTPVHGCGEWSDHEEWYHEEDDRTVEEFLADLWQARLKERGGSASHPASDETPPPTPDR